MVWSKFRCVHHCAPKVEAAPDYRFLLLPSWDMEPDDSSRLLLKIGGLESLKKFIQYSQGTFQAGETWRSLAHAYSRF